ncbi:hypothetical protein PHLGIDRAFT_76699, partial [Phlebiopsis gigantea 11061_1 CR5-6]
VEVPITISTPATLFVKVYVDVMHMPTVQRLTCIVAAKDDLAWVELINKYHILHIKISAYSSKANKVVERGHFIICEAIVKLCEGHINKWPDFMAHAFFANNTTVQWQIGYSPYFLVHGVDPVLPFDLTKASFLIQGFIEKMSTSNLLTLHIRQLEKHDKNANQSVTDFRKSARHSA